MSGKVIQFRIHIYLFFSESFPLEVVTKCWVESPVFSSRSLVVIYFMYSGVCMLIPNSYKFQSWTLANSAGNRGLIGFLKACLGVECIGRRRGSLRAGKGHRGIYWPVGPLRLQWSWPSGWAIRRLPVWNEEWGTLSDLSLREGLWWRAAESQLPHSVPRARTHLRGDVEAWDFRLSTEQLWQAFPISFWHWPAFSPPSSKHYPHAEFHLWVSSSRTQPEHTVNILGPVEKAAVI